jgi:hypothetical protein
MLKRELPDFRTVERWAVGLLREAGAIHKCDQHGWAKDRTDPYARDEALQTAAKNRPPYCRPRRRSRPCVECWNRSATPVQSASDSFGPS